VRANSQMAAQQQAHQERALAQHALWLAGLFEAGGSMGYSIYRGPGAQQHASNARASIGFQDREEERIRPLLRFGGTLQRAGETASSAWQWKLSGRQAIRLATAIAPSTPSRRPFMQIALRWEAMTIDERVQAIEAFQADWQGRWKHQLADPSAFDYTCLVQQPAFVAGVIDHRGSLLVDFTQERPQPLPIPVLVVSTPNRSLLAALQQQYGGRIAISRCQASGENVHWSLKGTPARHLYELIKPELLLRTYQAEQVFAQASLPGFSRDV
jgi:hypothetical protein